MPRRIFLARSKEEERKKKCPSALATGDPHIKHCDFKAVHG